MISVRIHSPAVDHLQVDFPICDCTPARRRIHHPECSSTSVAGFIATTNFWTWMTLSIMSMTSMSRSSDQMWITSVNGMVVLDEGKDSMPGMVKVILMISDSLWSAIGHKGKPRDMKSTFNWQMYIFSLCATPIVLRC